MGALLTAASSSASLTMTLATVTAGRQASMMQGEHERYLLSCRRRYCVTCQQIASILVQLAALGASGVSRHNMLLVQLSALCQDLYKLHAWLCLAFS